jgi:hypothetical protein
MGTGKRSANGYEKLKMNYEKYPIEKAKGTSTKYDKLV